MLFRSAVITGPLLSSIKWGKWKNWREYLPTFYYWALLTCYYEYISFIGNKHLWQFEKNFLSLFVTESMYTFVLYPCLIVMFLGNFPEERHKKFWRYVKWISLSFLIDALGKFYGAVQFSHGWSLAWEAFFYGTMYPMLRLHYKKPLVALFLSVFFVLFYLIIFDLDRKSVV